MASALEHAFKLAKQHLSDAQVVDNDYSETRSLIRIEGRWQSYRVIIQQIYRADASMRYAYYVLNASNHLIYAFDNHRDKTAIRLK